MEKLLHNPWGHSAFQPRMLPPRSNVHVGIQSSQIDRSRGKPDLGTLMRVRCISGRRTRHGKWRVRRFQFVIDFIFEDARDDSRRRLGLSEVARTPCAPCEQ